MAIGGSVASLVAQAPKAPGARFSVSTQESMYRFDTSLFSLDPSIKEHPQRLAGTGSSATFMVQVKRTFAITMEAFQNRTSGNGNWLDIDGLSPDDAAFLPVATGRTKLQIKGLDLDGRKAFRIGNVIPYIEAGGGIGAMKLLFSGTVKGVDPMDGESFHVAASDTVRRWIPIGSAGGGLEIPLRPGIFLVASGRWKMGPEIGFGIQYSLFHHAAK